MFKNRDQALTEYQRQIGTILNCITHSWAYAAPIGPSSYMLLSARADETPKPNIPGSMLRISRGKETLFLQAYQEIEIIDADNFRISTVRYYYIIWSSKTNERIIDWHYHRRKNGSFEAHLHVRDDAKSTGYNLINRHIPTGRVPLEDVVKFAIQELNVDHRDPDWKTVLEKTEAVFRANRTW